MLFNGDGVAVGYFVSLLDRLIDSDFTEGNQAPQVRNVLDKLAVVANHPVSNLSIGGIEGLFAVSSGRPMMVERSACSSSMALYLRQVPMRLAGILWATSWASAVRRSRAEPLRPATILLMPQSRTLSEGPVIGANAL